jgi:hypothetical protein
MRTGLGTGALTPVKENTLSRNPSRVDGDGDGEKGLHGSGSHV